MCVNHYLGPESHSVHTMKSTKIVVEENSTCNDVEVDDLLKRARQQRASLAEILTEKSIEKCDTQPEGTPKSPTISFFFFCILSTQKFPLTPHTPNGMKVIEIFIIYLFDSKLCSLSHSLSFVYQQNSAFSLYQIFCTISFDILTAYTTSTFFSIIHRKNWQKLTQKTKHFFSPQLYVNNCWLLHEMSHIRS